MGAISPRGEDLVAITLIDPLHALSLARTALSDPDALPPGAELDPNTSTGGEPVSSIRVAYAIELIDHVIGGLYFDPIEDPPREASATLDNLEPLVVLIAEGLGACASHGAAVEKIHEAAERLAEASTLLTSWPSR